MATKVDYKQKYRALQGYVRELKQDFESMGHQHHGAMRDAYYDGAGMTKNVLEKDERGSY